MSHRKQYASGSETLIFPLTVIIDFRTKRLDHVDPEIIELTIGQVLYGMIRNSAQEQYGRLVQWVVSNDDSAVVPLSDKLKYIDEIFEECYRNTRQLQASLRPYRDFSFEIDDVSYDREGENVRFTIRKEGTTPYFRRHTPAATLHRKSIDDVRPRVRHL